MTLDAALGDVGQAAVGERAGDRAVSESGKDDEGRAIADDDHGGVGRLIVGRRHCFRLKGARTCWCY
jgi:hypothetical protein